MAAQPLMTIEQFEEILDTEAPFARWLGIRTEDIGAGTGRVRLPYSEKYVRPGGSINGPMMLAVADIAMWVALVGLWKRGDMALSANLNISFLRPAYECDLIGEARVQRAGKRIAFMEAYVTGEGDAEPCAHVTGRTPFRSRIPVD